MNLWISHFDTTAENLACDQALLESTERSGDSWLRLWTPTTTAVILGYANQIDTEVNRRACTLHQVEVNRRISGGGTVFLGPGCLCYSITVPIVAGTPFENVSSTNRFIMETNRNALEQSLDRPIGVEGVTDLAVEGRKFSGNSQKRSQRALLFHGSLLLNEQLERIDRCLRHPSSEPEWRHGRSHLDFVTNLGAAADLVGNALALAWSAASAPAPPLKDRIDQLVQTRYATEDWPSLR